MAVRSKTLQRRGGSEYLYKCKNRPFDSCKEIGEKIRDLTVGVNLRYWDLDPNTAEYKGHADIWARQKNLLSDCLQKFVDKGCGPDDWPPEFHPERAYKEVRRQAPMLTGPGDFIRRGGLVPIGIGLGPVGVFVCVVCPSRCLAGTIPLVPVTRIVIGGGCFVGDPDCPDEEPKPMKTN